MLPLFANASYLAWDSILAEREKLDLSPHQVKQAETQKTSADGAVTARLPEAYQWLLVPVQATPQTAVEWQSFRLSGQDALAVRASKKLRNDELLVTSLAGTRLRMELDRVPLWRSSAGASSLRSSATAEDGSAKAGGDHVAIKQLVEDFARYVYLPRLKEPAVVLDAIRDGLGLLTWGQDSFAYADSFDEAAGRYRGLKCGQQTAISESDPGLLVRPEVARKQQETEAAAALGAATGTVGGAGATTTGTTGGTTAGTGAAPTPGPAPGPRRYHGSVTLDPTRVGRDASRIADEVIAHLVGLVGSSVTVTLEIEAEIPAGAPDNVARTVTENSRTLKFTSHGFEKE